MGSECGVVGRAIASYIQGSILVFSNFISYQQY